METSVLERFREPGAAYRGKPFWSWNGELDKEELLRQVHMFKEMGFGGFFMHSRTGLATEYLGEQWFELIDACAREAEKLGMEAWLYDEDRWPSGTAGGLVTEVPEYRLKFIRLRAVPADTFVWSEDTFAAFVCRLEGLAYDDCVPIARGEDRWLQEGKTVLAFSIEEQEKESFYNGYTYLDTLNREAVNRFLERTHEAYKAHNGALFGSAIKGIFTDEPHRGPLMDGFGLRNEDALWLAPWTYTLFEKFRSAFGYDLVPHLPELFLQPEGRSISQVKWHYVELLQQLFLDSFVKPINEWCERNGIVLTGHTLHEDSLSAQTAMVGSVMRFYEHMGYPGVDVLTEGNANYWIVKQLTSAARQLGKKWLLSELYGCTGWQMPFEAHKAVGDWQALFGINVRCHHLAWYTMEGEAKRDYPASISFQSAWWKEYEEVETYFSRLGFVLNQGQPDCGLLVLNPVESLWCQIHPGWSVGLSGRSPEVRSLERTYQDTFQTLAGAQIDFDYGDEEMMSRLGRIERDDEGRPLLRVGEAVYRAVLVSGLTTIRSTTLLLLRAFVEAGGRAVFAGEAPNYVDALPSVEGERLAELGIRIGQTEGEISAACREAVAPQLTVSFAETGESAREVYAQVRRDGDRLYLVLLNTNRRQWQRNVAIAIKGTGTLQEWLCGSGERLAVDSRAADGILRITVDFPPGGEHVYVLGPDPEPEERLLSAVRYADIGAAAIEGHFSYRLNEPNVCVLDRVSYRLNGGEEQEPLEVLKADRAIRGTLGMDVRHGEMIQPWYARKFPGPSLKASANLVLAYRFRIEHRPEQPMELAIERPERFRVRINGTPVQSDERRKEWWIDPCFTRIRLPDAALVEGDNEIELETEFHPGIDLEAIYLLGQFGVRQEEMLHVITRIPERLTAGSITEQGLPFYGGTLTYVIGEAQLDSAYRQIGSNEECADAFALDVSGFEAACARIRTADGAGRLLAWQPYEAMVSRPDEGFPKGPIEIDCVLTRRNTFGPLHQVPLHAPAYGPGNWLTGGDSFSESCVLLPTGLLEPPRLVAKRLHVK